VYPGGFVGIPNVHIRRLRKSLNGKGELDVVRTVRAAGYALDTEQI
jgi:two-component system phosphate regulon response regulator PhoB